MNKIEEVRAETRKYFELNNLIDGSLETFYSPTKNYRAETASYRQTKPETNWVSTRIAIFDNTTDILLFDLICNDRFFHEWLTIRGTEYLFCAEDMFGGQTVVDLTNRKMASYSTGADGYIWTEFFLSPNAQTLAVIGCVWAAPYTIKVYDITDPMDLPLKEIKEIDLIGSETITRWLDDTSFQTEGLDYGLPIDRVIRIDD